jgi:molecular chaperone DnaJ
MGICYYKTLGISVSASQEEIKKAFRMLALNCHPDRNPKDPHAGEHFRAAVEAYETLIDPRKRNRYDILRGHAKGNGSRGRRSRTSSRESSVSFEEALREAFGIHFAGAKERAVNDLRFDLQVPRSALAQGVYEVIDYGRVVFCGDCSGNGRNNGFRSCKRCNGDGELEELRSLKVWIPAGSTQGSRLRISGAGDQPSPRRSAGDLVILLHIIDAG